MPALTVQNAEIKTAAVEVKTLTISGKQAHHHRPCRGAVMTTDPTQAVIHSRITEVTLSAIPEDNINHDLYAVKVAWRGDDRYAVKRLSQCLGSDGEWDYEPSPSNRTDEWIAKHRFDYDTALRLAAEAAQHITVNGLLTVADTLARAARRD